MQKLTLAFVLAICMVVVIVLVSFRATQQSADTAHWVAHTHQVLSTLEQILVSAEAAETAQRAFVITGGAQYAEESAAQRPRIAASMAALRRLVTDSATQSSRVQLLQLAIDDKLRWLDRVIDVRERSGFESARDLIMT